MENLFGSVPSPDAQSPAELNAGVIESDKTAITNGLAKAGFSGLYVSEARELAVTNGWFENMTPAQENDWKAITELRPETD